MMKSPAAAEKFKADSAKKAEGATGSGNKNKKSSPDSDNEAPVTKKKKVELVFEDELKANEQISNGGKNHISMHQIFLFKLGQL